VIVKGRISAALKRAAIPYLRRNLGLVFQDQKLLYDRSVYDNAMLPLASRATRRRKRRGACARRSTRLGSRARALEPDPALRRRAATPRDRARRW